MTVKFSGFEQNSFGYIKTNNTGSLTELWFIVKLIGCGSWLYSNSVSINYLTSNKRSPIVNLLYTIKEST